MKKKLLTLLCVFTASFLAATFALIPASKPALVDAQPHPSITGATVLTFTWDPASGAAVIEYRLMRYKTTSFTGGPVDPVFTPVATTSVEMASIVVTNGLYRFKVRAIAADSRFTTNGEETQVVVE